MNTLIDKSLPYIYNWQSILTLRNSDFKDIKQDSKCLICVKKNKQIFNTT